MSSTSTVFTPAAGARSRRWAAILTALLSGADLTVADAAWAMDEILSGAASSARIAAFATALRAKGETRPAVRGLVGAVRAHGTPLIVPGRIVDIAGTGGAGGANISTIAAI